MRKVFLSIVIIAVIAGILPIPAVFAYPNTQEEFFEWLQNRGDPIVNQAGKLANFQTYKKYNLIVYGDPWGDSKPNSICPNVSGTQLRYLGYDFTNKPYTNSCFPQDAVGNKPENWSTYLKQEGGKPSWNSLQLSQKNFMKNATLSGNGASSPNFTPVYIGNKMGGSHEDYTKVLSGSTWRTEGSVFTQHYGANNKVWYATFTTPPMVGQTIVTGTINTPSGDNYILSKGSDQIEIPYSLTANAAASGVAIEQDILKLEARSAGNTATTSRKLTITLNNQKHVIKRSDYPVSNTDQVIEVQIKGSAYIMNIFKEEQEVPVYKTVKVTIQPEGDEPGIKANAETNPNSVKFNNADIKVTLNVSGELLNYTDAANVKEWHFFAREKTDTVGTTLQTKIVSGAALKQQTSFTFTIPKSRVTGQDYTEVYAVTAMAVLNKPIAGKTTLSAPAEAATYVYKEVIAPPPPPKDNIPPVAAITGTSYVAAGDVIRLNGDESYDPDGTVVRYDWDSPCSSPSGFGSAQEFFCMQPGTYTFSLAVEDNDGARSAPAYKSVVVRPPLPAAHIEVSGTLKENRKVTLDASGSTAPYAFPINHGSTTWEITAISGGTNADIKFSGGLTGAITKDVLFKKEGTYRVKLTVYNTYGSDSTEKIITIKPDLAPIMDTKSVSPVYRQSYYDNKALIELDDYSYSSDGDIIASRIVEVAYDNNNDGVCTPASEPYSALSSIIGKRYEYLAPKVGNYCFRVTATEDFGQATIPEFITAADYRTAVSVVMVKVDNYAPSASFGVLKKQYVDLVFNLGDSNYKSLDELKTKVNQIVLPELGANGIDAKVSYVDSRPSASKYMYFATRFIFWDNPNGYAINRYDPDSGEITQLKHIYIRDLNHIIWMPDDTFYYLSSDAKSILKYDPADNAESYVFTLSSGIITSFTVNKDLNIYFTNKWSGMMGIGVFNTQTKTLTQLVSQTEGFNGGTMQDAIADFNGNVYVRNTFSTNQSGYYKISPSGAVDYVWMYPEQLTAAPDGYMYSISTGFNQLYRNGSSGSLAEANIYGITSSRNYKYLYYRATMTSASLNYGRKSPNLEGLMRFDLKTSQETQIDPSKQLSIYGMSYDEKLYYRDSTTSKMYIYDPEKNTKSYAFDVISSRQVGTNHYEHMDSMFRQVATTDVKRAQPSDQAIKSVTWRENSNKYFVDVTNQVRSDLYAGDVQSRILVELLGKGISYNVLGSTANASQVNALIALIDGKGKHYVADNPDAALYSFSKDLVNKLNAEAALTQYILLGDSLEYHTSYLDPESDPKLAERWRYDHDFTVFQNNLGAIVDNGIYRSAPIITPDKVGKYEIQYQAQDNPTNNAAYAVLRKWSNNPGNTMTLYVHRKPFALFRASATISGGQYQLTISEYSYDLDHQSEANKGIVQKVWRYKRTTETSWRSGMPPSTMAANEKYLVSLKVKDVEGAWSDENIQLIDAAANQPPVALFTASPAHISMSQNITILDLSYDPDGDPIAERKWEAVKDGFTVYTGSAAPTASQLRNGASSKGLQVLGKYTLSLQVRDQPATGVSMWSNIYTQDIHVINMPPVATMTIPNGTQNNPTIFNTKRPTLSWAQTDTDAGTIFQRFQIQITNEANTQFILDSGELSQWTTSTSVSWTVNKDLPTGDKLRVRVRVYDGQVWSAWSPQTWMLINSPPVADFSWTPTPAWESDNIQLINHSVDPDGDDLTYSWTITDPNGSGISKTTKDPSISNSIAGTYKITLTVTDPYGLSDTVTKNIQVNSNTLSLINVLHDTQILNPSKYSFETYREELARPQSTFFAGEPFIAVATTSPNARSVKVDFAFPKAKYKVSSQFSNDPYPDFARSINLTTDDYISWRGTNFDRSYYFIPDGTYTVIFTATYANGSTKTETYQLTIKDSALSILSNIK